MKTDCTFFELQLTEYASDGLGATEVARLEDHLAACADCRAELAREQELRELLGSLPTVACPPLQAPTARPSRTSLWYFGGGLVAAVLLAALVAPGLLTKSRPTAELATADRVPTVEFTTAEIKQARHDVLATLVLTANILDRSRDRTVVEIFGRRLPRAVRGSLNHLDSAKSKTTNTPDPIPTGGQG